MGLFSKPRVSLQLLIMCFGSWMGLQVSAIALNDLPQDVVVKPLDTLELAENSEPSGQAAKVAASVDGDSTPDAFSSMTVGGVSLPLAQAESDSRDAIDQEPDDDDDGQPPTNAQPNDSRESEEEIDDELGILRVRSQPVGLDSELGRLRILPIEELPVEVEPEPTRQTSVFLTGRANVYGGNNLFRTPNPIDDRIYQTGIGVFAFPRLTDKTNLILSAEANVARYEDLSVVDYDELQFQAGIRQRLGSRSYGQINWRYQDLSTPGSDSFFKANYVELLLSRRDILNNRTWLDLYYQARLSSSDPEEFSRFSQIATGSLNYGFNPKTRASLLYQLFLDDYTEVSRYDTYHQVLGQLSHDLSSTTRLSLFTGFRFGRSSRSDVNFDDTIYGASININLPLF